MPVVVFGMLVAWSGLDVFADLVHLFGLPLDVGYATDIGAGGIAVELAVDVAAFVVFSLVLRWFVRRWVGAQPPDPPRVA